ncbi:MAG: hypothetical protein ACRC0L_05260 [Angustibacter sp.]
MNETDPEKPKRPSNPFGFPDFGTPEWAEKARELRLSGVRPLPHMTVRESPAEIAARKAAETAAEEAQAAYERQHRRLRGASPDSASKPKPEKPKKVSGRTVAAAEAPIARRPALGARAVEDISSEPTPFIPLAETPPPTRRDNPAPGRLSRRGVIGGG